MRQTHRVSQDLGTQHAHSVTPELLVTLPALCLHLLTTRSSCEPWSHPEDLSVNPAQPFRGTAASENSLGPPGRPPLPRGGGEHPGPTHNEDRHKAGQCGVPVPAARGGRLAHQHAVEDEVSKAQLHAPCVVEREGTHRSQKPPEEAAEKADPSQTAQALGPAQGTQGPEAGDLRGLMGGVTA